MTHTDTRPTGSHERTDRHSGRYLVLMVLIVATAVGLRMTDITADLPAYFAGGSQDFTTDAAYLTLYAKAAVQLGAWSLMGYEAWSAFQVTLISAVSYLFFLLFGVSRATAALAGPILQLAGILFFVLGCARSLKRETTWLIAALLATNYLLVLYGRVPFAENGLVFLTGVAFWVHCRWWDQAWGKVSVGILLALGALFGKSFGFLLLGGPALYLLVRRERLFKDLLLIAIPVILLTAAYALYFRSQGGLFAFVYEHGVAEHGSPKGFASVAGFVESLISVSRTGLHAYTPALSILVYLAVLAVLLGAVRLDVTAGLFYFMVGWIVTWLIVISPFNYQPVRYLFILTVPMIVLLGVVLQQLQLNGLAFRRPLSLWRAAMLQMLNWYAVFVFVAAVFYDTLQPDIMRHVVWISLPIALALTTIILLAVRFSRKDLKLPFRPSILPVIVLAVILLSDFWQFFAWFSNRSHTIEEASRDTAALLNTQAVIAGQYGPVLADNSTLQGFPLFLTDNLSADLSTLRQYPITHVAIGARAWDSLCARAPQLQAASIVTTFWLRDSFVRLVRINQVTSNPQAAAYQPSEFEQAVDWLRTGDLAATKSLLKHFVSQHPRNKVALVEDYYLTMRLDPPRQAQPIVDTLCTYYSSDYLVSLLAAIYYKYVADQTQDQSARAQAEAYYRQALRYSGKNHQNAEGMYAHFRPTDRIIWESK